jgi:hypothetical protein
MTDKSQSTSRALTARYIYLPCSNDELLKAAYALAKKNENLLCLKLVEKVFLRPPYNNDNERRRVVLDDVWTLICDHRNQRKSASTVRRSDRKQYLYNPRVKKWMSDSLSFLAFDIDLERRCLQQEIMSAQHAEIPTLMNGMCSGAILVSQPNLVFVQEFFSSNFLPGVKM